MKSYKINEITNKRILGRNVLDAGKTDKPLALFWGASALEFKVRAHEVWIQVSSEYDESEPWIAVEVNGFPTNRFMVHKGEPVWVCVAAHMNLEKENLITILKDCQPMSGEAKHSLFIHQVGLSDEGQFCELTPRKLKIEFIGDSITSGEGLAGGPNEQDWITQWFSSSKTYALQTAKALNADWSMFSQSGWGLCWGWDGNIHSEMPSHYEEVCSVMWGEYQQQLGVQQKYDFGWGSDFVVLNLGTNDNNAFTQPAWKDENNVEHPLDLQKDGKLVYETAKSFLSKIRKYNPSAKILWTWGMIKLDKVPEFIIKAVDDYKKESGDENVFTLELEAMEDVEINIEDKGSRSHPGPKTHLLAAKKISAFLENLK